VPVFQGISHGIASLIWHRAFSALLSSVQAVYVLTVHASAGLEVARPNVAFALPLEVCVAAEVAHGNHPFRFFYGC
jgi:hypothetical protein